MGMAQFRYDGKRVLVAGAATGMGAAVSKLVTQLGGEVYVADVKPVDYPVAKAVQMDLRDESSIDAALAEIGAPIHSIFSCAGVSGAPFSPVDVMLINFVGARHLVESAAESMMPEGSSIAFISSIGGLGWEKVLDRALEFLATPDYASAQRWCEANVAGAPEQAEETAAANYQFSKRVINVYVQREAVPLCHRGIRINATGPGPTMTPLMDATPTWQMFGDMMFKAAMQRDPQTPEEQAPPLVFLNSPAAYGVSGQILNVDAGYTAGGVLGLHATPVVDSLVTDSREAKVDRGSSAATPPVTH
jgi:NAD(P)-dependent dehydrogenase (short-subunit alcohol dehydrogenase family)